MLDSLVRVSRRVNENHFVRISNTAACRTPASDARRSQNNFVVQTATHARTGTAQTVFSASVCGTIALAGYNRLARGQPYLPSSFLSRHKLTLTRRQQQTAAPRLDDAHDDFWNVGTPPPRTRHGEIAADSHWFPVLPS